jgi:hypothetical protein
MVTDLLIRYVEGRVEAAGLALPLWPLARLVEIQESRCACGEARGGGGLEAMTTDPDELTYLRVMLAWTRPT